MSMSTEDIQYYHGRGTSVDQLVENGATISELKEAGIGLSEILESNQNLKTVKEEGNYTLEEMLNASKQDRFGVTRLSKTFYYTVVRRLYMDQAATLTELKDAGITYKELRQSGATLSMLVDSGASVTDLKEAGFSISTLLAYYPADSTNKIAVMQALYENGTSISQLYEAGCSVSELVTAGATLSMLAKSSVPIQLLITYGYTLKELIDEGVSIKRLKEAGYTNAQIIDASTSGITGQLKRKTARKDIALKLYNSGVTIAELVADGITLSEMVGAGISLKTLLEAGYTIEDLQECGVTTSDILKANSEEATLQAILESGVYTIDDYFEAFISEDNIDTLKNTYEIYDDIHDWMDTNTSNGNISLRTMVNDLIRIEFIMNTAQEDRYDDDEPDKTLLDLIKDLRESEVAVLDEQRTLTTANELVEDNKASLQKTCMHGFVDDFIRYSTNPKEYTLIENVDSLTCVICGAHIPSTADALRYLEGARQQLSDTKCIERLKMVGVFTLDEIEYMYEAVTKLETAIKKLRNWMNGIAETDE